MAIFHVFIGFCFLASDFYSKLICEVGEFNKAKYIWSNSCRFILRDKIIDNKVSLD